MKLSVIYRTRFSRPCAADLHPGHLLRPQFMSSIMQIQQIRNATLKLSYAGKTFLIDPMLAGQGAYPGLESTINSERRRRPYRWMTFSRRTP